jgi:Flp pilus assembly pilin Flp
MKNLFRNDAGQDIAEYAILLAVILGIAVVLINTIGRNAGEVFSQIGSKIQ